jgi:hypothetical protein
MFYEIHRFGTVFETEDDERRHVLGDVSAADQPAKSINFRYTPEPPSLEEALRRVTSFWWSDFSSVRVQREPEIMKIRNQNGYPKKNYPVLTFFRVISMIPR